MYICNDSLFTMWSKKYLKKQKKYIYDLVKSEILGEFRKSFSASFPELNEKPFDASQSFPPKVLSLCPSKKREKEGERYL